MTLQEYLSPENIPTIGAAGVLLTAGAIETGNYVKKIAEPHFNKSDSLEAKTNDLNPTPSAIKSMVGKTLRKVGKIAGYTIGMAVALPTTHRIYEDKTKKLAPPFIIGSFLLDSAIVLGSISGIEDRTTESPIILGTLGALVASHVLSGVYEWFRDEREKITNPNYEEDQKKKPKYVRMPMSGDY